MSVDAVVFAGVGKTFADGTRALKDVSFTVGAGEFCVILGPSGSGKSTLLRTVNGLSAPDAGCIVLGGEAITPIKLPRLRRRVAMIYQQFALIGRASVAHNVIAGALPAMPTLRAVLGLFSAKDKQKACDLLAAVGLSPEHLSRRVGELSGGQQQRVGIARAFMADPAVILADEPVASLDPRTSRDIMALLRREARERGATVLCSLHQLDLAMEFADRIVALRNGEVIFNGPPSAFTRSVETRIYAVDTALAS